MENDIVPLKLRLKHPRLIGWAYGLVLLTGFALLSRCCLARPENTAFKLLSAIESNRPQKVKQQLTPQLRSAFAEFPNGLLSPKSPSEPNLAFLTGRRVAKSKLDESLPAPVSSQGPCERFFFCPEQASVDYELRFDPQPYVVPVEMVLGGAEATIVREQALKRYGENPQASGSLFLTRRISDSPIGITIPLRQERLGSTANADRVSQDTPKKRSPAVVLDEYGVALPEQKIAKRLPRLKQLHVKIALQRAHPLADWSVQGIGFSQAQLALPNGQTVSLE